MWKVKKWNRLRRVCLIPSSGIIYRRSCQKRLLHHPSPAGAESCAQALLQSLPASCSYSPVQLWLLKALWFLCACNVRTATSKPKKPLWSQA